MNICMIHSGSEEVTSAKKWLHGRLSYIARGNKLLAEKLPAEAHGGIMIIAANEMDEYITPGIYDECRKRGYSAVFLDCDEKNEQRAHIIGKVSDSLTLRGLSVFCPLIFSDSCPSAIPVAEAALSGGNFSEYLKYLQRTKRRIALSIPRITADFAMPVQNPSGRPLTQKELSRILNLQDAKPHFSPQLMVNYAIYSPAKGECRFVLFDDAHTISEKLRIAKRLGFNDVFLTYRELSDILGDISF